MIDVSNMWMWVALAFYVLGMAGYAMFIRDHRRLTNEDCIGLAVWPAVTLFGVGIEILKTIQTRKKKKQ